MFSYSSQKCSCKCFIRLTVPLLSIWASLSFWIVFNSVAMTMINKKYILREHASIKTEHIMNNFSRCNRAHWENSMNKKIITRNNFLYMKRVWSFNVSEMNVDACFEYTHSYGENDDGLQMNIFFFFSNSIQPAWCMAWIMRTHSTLLKLYSAYVNPLS